jgi:hypothetical protein
VNAGHHPRIRHHQFQQLLVRPVRADNQEKDRHKRAHMS